MPMSPEAFVKRREQREKLNDESRKLLALEQIADALASIQIDVSVLSVNLQSSMRR